MDLRISLATHSEFKAEQVGQPEALRIAADLFGTNPGEPSGRTFKTMQPLGLIARPRDPDVDANTGKPTNGANVLHGFIGNDAYAMPLGDPRFLAKVPPIKKGGVALYSAPGAILNFDGDDGCLSILVPKDEHATANHLLQIDPASPANIQLQLANGQGLALVEGGKNSSTLHNAAGDAYVEVNDEGVTINGNLTLNGGLALGEIEAAQPIALAPAYFAVVEQIAALIHAIALAVNGVAPGSVSPAQLAALDVLLSELPTQGQSTKLSASP